MTTITKNLSAEKVIYFTQIHYIILTYAECTACPGAVVTVREAFKIIRSVVTFRLSECTFHHMVRTFHHFVRTFSHTVGTFSHMVRAFHRAVGTFHHIVRTFHHAVGTFSRVVGTYTAAESARILHKYLIFNANYIIY